MRKINSNIMHRTNDFLNTSIEKNHASVKPINKLNNLICILLISTLSCAQNDENWEIHQLDKNLPYKTGVFVDKPTISGMTFHSDKSSIIIASKFDRVLFILEGNSKAIVNAKTFNLKIGDVVFLKANDAIKFSSAIKTMVWTSKSNQTDHKSITKKFTKAQIEASRDSSENVWHSFIETSTMVTGLYMLPKSLNGDGTLNHSFDEINYVVNGTAKFKMDEKVIDVKPGSIMWVKRGVGHYFYDLSDDFDVFILFETINMNH